MKKAEPTTGNVLARSSCKLVQRSCQVTFVPVSYGYRDGRAGDFTRRNVDYEFAGVISKLFTNIIERTANDDFTMTTRLPFPMPRLVELGHLDHEPPWSHRP